MTRSGRILGWVALACLFCATQVVRAQPTTFTFTLDEPSKTTAGVYTPSGTLVRTLWSKVRYYSAGTYSAVWDGLDDNSNAAPAGTYQIRLLQHNTEYVWDGAIGNTSAEVSGPTVHAGFWPIADMSISGAKAFYVSGYNEGKYDFRQFLTTDPQHVQMAWYWVYSPMFNRVSSMPGDVNDLNWLWAAADSNHIYFACSATPNPSNLSVPNVYPGAVIACNVADNSPAYFTSGVQILNNGANSPLPNGVHVGTQPGLSGIAVQQNGNLLAVSVSADNRVYLLDKLAGTTLNSISINSPGRLSFSPDGSLWIISGTSVIQYTGVSSNPTAALTIRYFSEPLAVAVNPSNPNIILVADGGASQQVKAFNSSGASLWLFGLPGGYQSNGVAVTTNKFWFTDGQIDETFLSFAPDGSFWVGDGGNSRALHFSATLNYIEQIMYQPRSYLAAVDQNNPSRVFNQFSEFTVDYTKPLSQGWTLVSNWQANVPPVNISWNKGLYEVVTLTNGRTYALVDNNTYQFAESELGELTPPQMRLTGVLPAWSWAARGWISLAPDGSARRTTIGAPTWYEDSLAGFDSSNNPIYNPDSLMATASANATDPLPRGGSFGNIRATVSSNNVLISFDQSLNNGWHLGGIILGATNWLWKASPAVSLMNGTGNYEIANSVAYAGNTLQAIDRNVIYGYHGEFFRNQGQAGQTMHFYDDGLFVGQFGEANPGHSAYEGVLPGFAGNGQAPNLVKTTNGDFYLWVNDESDHGPQRWHFVNARNIRELTGSGILGGSFALTNPVAGFPSGLLAENGNQCGEVSWQPVPGAASYNIRYSLLNGGPYSAIVGNTTNLSCLIQGLINGQTYYIAVTAIQGGNEGIPSEQVVLNPLDTTQNVIATGSMTEGGQFTPVVDISTSAMSSNAPSYIGAEQYTGVLNLRELDDYGYGNLQNETVGTQGYALYDWQGPGSSLVHIPGPFTVTLGSGWSDIPYLERQYRVDNDLGANNGLVAGPTASINIAVTDTNYHYLTVVSPAQYNNARIFTMRLASVNGGSAAYSLNETPGLSHVFQFLFKGNVTLTADASVSGGSDAIVQSLFLDNSPVTYATSSSGNLQLLAATTTTVTSTLNPALPGAVVTFNATVSGSGGIPTGAVAFYDGSVNLGTGYLNGSGASSFSTTNLSSAGSPHSITAVYGGDSVFTGSTSSILTQNILATSSLALSSSQNPAPIGTTVTITATASGSGPTPTGTINFYDGSSSIGVATLNGSGAASMSTSSLSSSGSPHSITAVYSGNSAYAGSVSGILSQIISNTPIGTVTLASSLDPAPAGSTVTFYATVSGSENSGAVGSYASQYITSGLVEWNKMNDGSGTLAADSSGNGNTLPLVGSPAWSSNYLTLNGTTQYGDAGSNQLSSLDLHDLTICAWINKTGSSIKAIVDKDYDNPGSGHGGWTFKILANNHLDWWVEDGLDLQDTGLASVPLGQWTFVAVVWHYSTSQAQFYINGVLDSTVQNGAVIQSPSLGSHLEVGNMRNNTSGGLYAFDGSMHDVGIYNRALSPGEIQTNFQNSQFATNVSIPDLLYYEMTEYPQSNPPVLFADSSIHGGTTGTLNLIGPVHWVSNVVPNNAIHFNGVNSILDTGNSSLFNFTTNLFTISFWIRPLTANGYVMQNGLGTINGWYVQVGGAYQVYLGTEANGVDTQLYTGPGAAQVNGWDMVTIVRTSQTTASIYINGLLDVSGNISSPASSTSTLQIGLDGAGNNHLDGDLWMTQIWGEPLSASSIANLFFMQSTGYPWPVNSQGGVSTGTVAFYDGTNNLGTGTLNASGVAVLSTSTLSAAGSPHSITAVYSGNAVFAQSTSSPLSQIITNPVIVTPSITNGLVAYYPLASNGVDLLAGNNLTLAGSPGFSSGSINWNGALPTYGYSTPEQWPQSGLTVAAWINMSDPTGNYNLAACYGGTNAVKAAYFQFFTSSKGLNARIVQNIDANYIGRATSPVLTSGWHFAVFTWSGGASSSSIRIYLDGAQVDNSDANGGTFTGSYSGSAVPFSVGAQLSDGYGIYGDFYGSENGVLLYNRPLALSEIDSIYSTGFSLGNSNVITLVSSQNPILAGLPVTFTASVTGSVGTPTGTVTFFDGTNNLGVSALNAAGAATFSTSSLSASGSPHPISATYSGNTEYASSTSSTISQAVTSTSATSLASSQNPALAGVSVTFTATVSGSVGTPTGTVTFYDGTNNLGNGTLNGSGLATLSTSTLSASGSPHSITAVYGGNTAYVGSTSSVVSQSITSSSATTLASSTNPAPAGVSVTFTATVTGGVGTPTGTVTFFDGVNNLGVGTLNGSGLATLSTSALSASGSPHSITAVYSGNTAYAGSTSTALSQSITSTSTTSLASSTNPAPAGVSITFTATVTGSVGTPTGTVTFFDGTNNLGVGTLNGSGITTLATSSLSGSGSPHSITAVYGGNAAYAGSTSSVLSQTITSSSTTSLASSQNPALTGVSVTFTATVTGSVGTPTGAVTFFDAANNLGVGTLNGSGIATLSTSTLSASGSPHSITAVYSGNAAYTGSTSTALSQSITTGSTTALASSTNPAPAGVSVTFTATITGSLGTPTGTVTFFDGANNLGVGTLNASGITTLSTSGLSVSGSPHSVTAVYGGNSSYAGNSSTILTQYITTGSTTTLASSQNPALAGASITFTATVSGGVGTATGTVTFFDGANNLGSGTLNPFGVATFSTSALSAGGPPHSITAMYSGSTAYVASTSTTLSQSITSTSTTSLASSTNPAPAGVTVTFTATVSGSVGAPTGTVTFFDGTNTLGLGTLNGSGITTFSTSGLSASASPHSITAVYSGDTNYVGSTSAALSQIINNTNTPPANVTNGLVAYYPLALNGNDAWAANNLSLVGSPTFSSSAVNWNASVPTYGYSAPQQWPQSGLTIAAWINMTDPTANYSVASCYGSTSGLKAAYFQFFTQARTLTARMVQTTDVNYIGRTTSGSLTSGWHFVAFTWSGGTSSTSISVYLDGAQIDNANANGGSFSGVYSGNAVPFAVGAQLSDGYGVFGDFSGSENRVMMYNRALSQSEIGSVYTNGISIGVTATKTTLASSPNPAQTGNTVTFTATVTGTVTIPTGTVAFFDGPTNLGSGTLNASGVATWSTNGLTVGGSPHSITAIYSGDTASASSASPTLSQIILPGPKLPSITNGLVAYYPLATNANDSWAANNLNLVGSPTFSSSAINWNASAPTYGYTAPEQWPQSGLTIAAWINMTDPTANYSIASCYGSTSGLRAAYFQFFTQAKTLTARMVQTTDVNYIGRTTSGSLTSGWHFVAFTWSGGTSSASISVYLDGVQIDNANANGGSFTGVYSGNAVPFAVGAQLSDGYGIFGDFSGKQSGVMMYNRPLSQTEIGTIYGNGLPQ